MLVGNVTFLVTAANDVFTLFVGGKGKVAVGVGADNVDSIAAQQNATAGGDEELLHQLVVELEVEADGDACIRAGIGNDRTVGCKHLFIEVLALSSEGQRRTVGKSGIGALL